MGGSHYEKALVLSGFTGIPFFRLADDAQDKNASKISGNAKIALDAQNSEPSPNMMTNPASIKSIIVNVM